jgi:alanine racemase
MRTLERTATRYRPTVAVVDLGAIQHNVSVLKPARAELMAVVKADGYGHGAVEVARAALKGGAEWLGVALVEEGIVLRDAGIDARILLLTEFPPGSEAEGLRAGLTPTLYSQDGLARLASASKVSGSSPAVHVKVDTGMHRVGLAPDRAVDFVHEVTGVELTVEALWTHLAASEDLSEPFTEEQLERFASVASAVMESGVRPRYLHAANSGGVLGHPRSHLDLVRVGIAMYGVAPGPDLAGVADLRPALSWRSAVSAVRRVGPGEGISYGLRYRTERHTTIATIPVGYADGYPRALSNRGEVLIRGRRRRVAGTVTMDQIMVDCENDLIEVGGEVILIGRQEDSSIPVEEVSAMAETIPYEILCGISHRVPRTYVTGEAA